MKKSLFLLLWLILPVFCMAQNALPREYWYDNAGNRTVRRVIDMQNAPPAPTDSIMNEDSHTADLSPLTANLSPHTADLSPHTADLSPLTADYFVERFAQTEIKIYPNPTTEKITLEIAGWETLQTGVFKLFTLNGQLLQEQPVHSVSTEVSLTGLAKGTYILKVHINNHIEDWKIIKN